MVKLVCHCSIDKGKKMDNCRWETYWTEDDLLHEDLLCILYYLRVYNFSDKDDDE